MSKSRDAFRTISEVADWLGTPAHVLRFWESKFTQIKPVKRAGGRRYYRPNDMLLLGGLKKLLHEDGVTIKGAQAILREKGIKHVIGLSHPLDAVADAKSSIDSEQEKAPLEDTANGPAIAQDAPQDAEIAARASDEPDASKSADEPQVVGLFERSSDTTPQATPSEPEPREEHELEGLSFLRRDVTGEYAQVEPEDASDDDDLDLAAGEVGARADEADDGEAGDDGPTTALPHFLHAAAKNLDQHLESESHGGSIETESPAPVKAPEPAGPTDLIRLRQVLKSAHRTDTKKLLAARDQLVALRARMVSDAGPLAS